MDKSAPTSPLEDRVAALHAQPRLRVWSLVVTLLGDAIVPRGGLAGLGIIQAVMDRIGVDSGAVRTAMSRLASDGWVTREREGRLAFYRLAADGRHAFDAASRRIYAAGAPRWDGQWTVLVAPPDLAGLRADALGEAGFMRIAPGVFLRADAAGAPDAGEAAEGILSITGAGSELPGALAQQWASDGLAEAYSRFLAGWQPVADALASGLRLPPLDAMAARTLLIHDWRRLVLRDPGLPEALLPPDWPAQEARLLARRIYTPLVAASEEWLSSEGVPPQRDPATFAQRFGIQPEVSVFIE
ncbi:MAG: phenylacetic acid degradation protein [Notoacmeibacter sp.]|nr:phenylacetic acid degradation protein [Notoacmeibacter sp.]MCC0033222.1 phenylacetic acid degradation protein [Brucellaceae bacterium]